MKQILKLHEQTDPKKKVSNSRDIFDSIEKIDIDYDQENFLVFFMNTQNRLLKCEVLFKGSINACIIDPKIIFKKALLNKAIAIIVAHNHPSGNLAPSAEDIDITRILKDAGQLLDIDVLDSIIFNTKEYYSLSDKGDLSWDT